MKKLLLIAITCLITTLTYSQDNPYAIFGYKLKAQPKPSPVDIYKVTNHDPKSNIRYMIVNREDKIIKLLDDRDSIVKTITYTDQEVFRWTSIDPLSAKYFSLSPYHYAGNNPIRNVDIDGREFTDEAWKHVNELISEVNSRQKSNNQNIAKKQEQLSKGGLSEKQVNRLNKQIGKLESNNNQLEQVRGETATLAASSQVYNVNESTAQNESGPIPGMETIKETTAFNFQTKAVDITISPGAGIDLFAHELKHAFQFETGQISLGASGGLGRSFLLDKTDENEAYERQNLFKQSGYGNGRLPDGYESLPNGSYNYQNYNLLNGFQDAVKNKNAVGLNQAAHFLKQAFRINGTTYSGF